MDTTTRTRMFARVIGPYFVIVSLTAALRAPDMQAVLSDFEASPVWSSADARRFGFGEPRGRLRGD